MDLLYEFIWTFYFTTAVSSTFKTNWISKWDHLSGLSDFTTCSDGLGLKKMGPEWTLYLYFVPKYADDADEALMP